MNCGCQRIFEEIYIKIFRIKGYTIPHLSKWSRKNMYAYTKHKIIRETEQNCKQFLNCVKDNQELLILLRQIFSKFDASK